MSSNSKENTYRGIYTKTRYGRIGKAYGRDVIPPYLSGLLDKFLDGFYVPALKQEMSFQCTFCDQD